jgi:SAM-dependent methyltransferase
LAASAQHRLDAPLGYAAMKPMLYTELVPWYRLLDPTADHAGEALCYERALELAASPTPQTMLELGAGAGNNAFYLKRRFRSTLADLSEPMQALSRALNPECEHVLGDMRTLRLGRAFDVVFVQDAVMYMTSEEDLLAVARTAFEHTRPGGGALFTPDFVRETFRESSSLHSGDDESRSMRCLEWTWDPDTSDDTYLVEYAFLLRDGADLRAVHDRHLEGLFSRSKWVEVLERAGYRVETSELDLGEDYLVDGFICRRP